MTSEPLTHPLVILDRRRADNPFSRVRSPLPGLAGTRSRVDGQASRARGYGREPQLSHEVKLYAAIVPSARTKACRNASRQRPSIAVPTMSDIVARAVLTGMAAR